MRRKIHTLAGVVNDSDPGGSGNDMNFKRSNRTIQMSRAPRRHDGSASLGVGSICRFARLWCRNEQPLCIPFSVSAYEIQPQSLARGWRDGKVVRFAN